MWPRHKFPDKDTTCSHIRLTEDTISTHLLPAWGRHARTHTHTHTSLAPGGQLPFENVPMPARLLGFWVHGAPRLPSLPFPHNPRWGQRRQPTLSSAWLSPINAAGRNKAPHTGMGVAPAQRLGPRPQPLTSQCLCPKTQPRTHMHPYGQTELKG